MPISTLSYVNKTTGWELKPVSFDQLTLLTGRGLLVLEKLEFYDVF